MGEKQWAEKREEEEERAKVSINNGQVNAWTKNLFRLQHFLVKINKLILSTINIDLHLFPPHKKSIKKSSIIICICPLIYSFTFLPNSWQSVSTSLSCSSLYFVFSDANKKWANLMWGTSMNILSKDVERIFIQSFWWTKYRLWI